MTHEQQTDLTRFMFFALSVILENQAVLLDKNNEQVKAEDTRDTAKKLIIISEKYLKGENENE